MDRGARIWLICGILLLSVVAVLFLPRMPQSANYHEFADTRIFLGIPNLLNVISNLPFLLVGILGLRFLFGGDAAAGPRFLDSRERWPYTVFFSRSCAGVLRLFLLSRGSRQRAPGVGPLAHDPGFMALVSAVIAERISVVAGLRSLLPLLLVGAASVLYWRVTELHGSGDLRFYGIVQFGSLLTILMLLGLLAPRYTRGMDFVAALGFYVLAKILETLDPQLFSLGRLVSGHTLKHLAAALSAYWILRMLRIRIPATSVVQSNATRLSVGAAFRGTAEARGKVAQKWRLEGQFEPANFLAPSPNFQNHFHNVINVRLRVNAPRNREAQQIHRPGVFHTLLVALSEHQRSDFDGADSSLDIKFRRQAPRPEIALAERAAKTREHQCKSRGRPAAARSALLPPKCDCPGTPWKQCDIADNLPRALRSVQPRWLPDRGQPARHTWENLPLESANPFRPAPPRRR